MMIPFPANDRRFLVLLGQLKAAGNYPKVGSMGLPHVPHFPSRLVLSLEP